MERQCRWYSNLEDVRDHRPDCVLWYRHGYEAGPLIFPAEATPHIHGSVTKMGTIEELLAAMRQAIATDASLRRSIEHHNALVIQAQVSENGTTYNFRPVRESRLLNN